MPIFVQALKESWKGLIAWAVALIAIMTLYLSFYSTMDAGEGMQIFIDQLPSTMVVAFGFGDIGCAVWPVSGESERTPITAEGAPPILVIGTTGDPATPYEWAVALADQLDSGVLVTYEGEGHTAYRKSNSCIDSTVESFLLEGTVPESDPQC